MEVEPVDEPKKNSLRNSPAKPMAASATLPAEVAPFVEDEKKRSPAAVEGSKSQRTVEEESKRRKQGGESSAPSGAQHKRHTSHNSQGY